ncbi:hypothetical protein ACHAW6_007212 [Cyclotella cf. meneghiniana]
MESIIWSSKLITQKPTLQLRLTMETSTPSKHSTIDPPPTKRHRTNAPTKEISEQSMNTNGQGNNIDDQNKILDPIATHVLVRAEDWAAAYRDATPYPHGVIRDFCKHGFLDEILNELKQNTKVKFKETDLFRFYQSIDLGNLKDGSELANKMPCLVKLKNAVYSAQYRAFIEKITGLEEGTLTDEVDCAANCHAKGCHLLCHDDVIGTRKVSYIIYLTDPDPIWEDKDGGRLELYEAQIENTTSGESGEKAGQRFVPGALPVKTIVPAFNSMAYFVVEPGVSFHSVQEVFCDRPRLSIQGWYHAKGCPSKIENATLQRLKSLGKGEDTEGEFQPMETETTSTCNEEFGLDDETNPLTRKDSEFLMQYINPAYLSEESMKEIRLRFEEESSVKLRHFLIDEWSARCKEACIKEDERDELGNDRPALDYDVGSNDDWKVIGPAHKQRFLEYTKEGPPVGSYRSCAHAGEYLHQVRRTLFESPSFGRWLGWISSLGFPLGHRGRIRRFRPGLDYTVAHYGILTTHSVLDATLCFCAGNGDQCCFDEGTNELIGSDDDAVWESGDVGGFECYIAADESGEDQGPDAEYDEEDDTKLLSVSASDNTLSLVYRDPGTMRFVKYVGIGAPSSRWDIALEYDVKSNEDSDDENSATEKAN